MTLLKHKHIASKVLELESGDLYSLAEDCLILSM